MKYKCSLIFGSAYMFRFKIIYRLNPLNLLPCVNIVNSSSNLTLKVPASENVVCLSHLLHIFAASVEQKVV